MQSPYDYKMGFEEADNRWKKKIEDIKAEIKNPLEIERVFDTTKAQAKALKWCLEIIDKHISGKQDSIRKGHWIDADGNTVKMIDGVPQDSCWCSECKEWLVASDEYSCKGYYCPNCGVGMESEE